MKHIYTKLTKLFVCLHILLFANPIFTAAPRPITPGLAARNREEAELVLPKEQEYYYSLMPKYPLHALITLISTDDEYQKIIDLLNTGAPLCAADETKGNTPFHLLTKSYIKEDYSTVKTKGASETPVLTEKSTLQEISNFITDTCNIEFTLKWRIVVALCSELEKRAEQKAMALNTLSTINCAVITNSDGTIVTPPKNIRYRKLPNGTHMQMPENTIFELPTDALNIILSNLDFDGLMAFRLISKTAYADALYTAARTVKKKYVLDNLNINNRAGQTALEVVKKSVTDEELEKHKQKITSISFPNGSFPLPMETMLDWHCLREKELLLLQQYTADHLEQLQAKYAAMPENITGKPKQTEPQENVNTQVPRTLRNVAMRSLAKIKSIISAQKKH